MTTAITAEKYQSCKPLKKTLKKSTDHRKLSIKGLVFVKLK